LASQLLTENCVRPTILISDDDPLLVKALYRATRRFGLRVITDTGSLVVQLAAEHRPDLIVLDLIQRIDGRDLLQALKTDGRTQTVPVVVLSGVEDQHTRHLCLRLGAKDYDVKPFEPTFIHKLARLAFAHAQTPDPWPFP
jgi:two-component system, OmpR family, response regulator AdeR